MKLNFSVFLLVFMAVGLHWSGASAGQEKEPGFVSFARDSIKSLWGDVSSGHVAQLTLPVAIPVAEEDELTRKARLEKDAAKLLRESAAKQAEEVDEPHHEDTNVEVEPVVVNHWVDRLGWLTGYVELHGVSTKEPNVFQIKVAGQGLDTCGYHALKNVIYVMRALQCDGRALFDSEMEKTLSVNDDSDIMKSWFEVIKGVRSKSNVRNLFADEIINLVGLDDVKGLIADFTHNEIVVIDDISNESVAFRSPFCGISRALAVKINGVYGFVLGDMYQNPTGKASGGHWVGVVAYKAGADKRYVVMDSQNNADVVKSNRVMRLINALQHPTRVAFCALDHVIPGRDSDAVKPYFQRFLDRALPLGLIDDELRSGQEIAEERKEKLSRARLSRWFNLSDYADGLQVGLERLKAVARNTKDESFNDQLKKLKAFLTKFSDFEAKISKDEVVETKKIVDGGPAGVEEFLNPYDGGISDIQINNMIFGSKIVS